MDSNDATSILFSRIQSLDPENVSKIMGYILFQDFGEKEKMKLAFGPDNLLLSLIIQAKAYLGLSSNSSSTPSSPSPFSPISNLTRTNSLTQSSSRIIIPKNGFHMNPSSPSSPWSLSGFSDHRSPNSHLSASPRPASSLSYAAVVNGTSNGASGSFSSSPNTSFSVPFYGDNTCNDFNDEYSTHQVHNQLSFLEDSSLKNTDFMDPIVSPSGRSDSLVFPYGSSGSNWVESGNCGDSHHPQLHRRSCSVNDVFLGGVSDDGGSGFGWRPCMYFARGFCKNGNSCKFSHGGFADSLDASDAIVGSPSKIDGLDEFLKMKAIQQQRFAAASHLMSGAPFPYNKGMNFLNDTQRSAAAALMLDEEFHKFGRCRPGRSEFSALGFGGNGNSSSRQIYLTFPADSTFKEEDVSNYFNMFGPVQDVRIPYQQKRMFGFVTFVHPETVRLILAKGNPHFVCDSRVLVKPYKEKGKLPDKKQQQQQLERGEFSRLSPPGLDSREPCDLPIGARMFYNTQEMLLRRKLEEQAELQQAIELQGRRLMNVQLMDLKNHHHSHQFQPNLSPSIPIPLSTPSHGQMNQSLMLPSDSINEEVPEGNNGCSDAAANSQIVEAEQNLPQDLSEACINKNDNYSGNGKEESSNLVDSDFHESLEHILPDNLFASPTKLAGDHHSIFSTASVDTDVNTPITTTSSNSIPMLPNTSTL